MRPEAIDTPEPVIDLDRVEANLRRAQDYADAHGLRLRPHIKTHKIPELARRQIELGAIGITCQKLGEAEAMADGGIRDILLTFNLLGRAKLQRLVALARRIRLSVTLDNAVVASELDAAMREAGLVLPVLIECDTGGERCGVQTPEEAVELARRVRDSGPLAFRGLMTYPHGPGTAPFVAAAPRCSGAEGVAIGTVFVGGTPDFGTARGCRAPAELRVGTYVYNDAAPIVGAGAATIDGLRAARARHRRRPPDPTTGPSSTPAPRRSRAIASAPSVGEGCGLILDYPEADDRTLNEGTDGLDLSRCVRRPESAERVHILPTTFRRRRPARHGDGRPAAARS